MPASKVLKEVVEQGVKAVDELRAPKQVITETGEAVDLPPRVPVAPFRPKEPGTGIDPVVGDGLPPDGAVEGLYRDAARKAVPLAASAGVAATFSLPSDEARADDLESTYLNSIKDRETKAAMEELFSMMAQSEQGQTQPATAAPDAVQPSAITPDMSTPQKLGTLALNVGTDVATAVTLDFGRVLLGGVRDATQEVIDLWDEAAQTVAWLWSGEEIPSADVKLPEVPEPRSATGAMARDIIQFLTGFKGAGKLLGKLQPASGAGKAGKAAVQGAIADFAAFDPHEARFANLLKEMGVDDGTVVSYLAADPQDEAIEGRLKNALEGAVAGTLLEGLLAVGRVLRAAKKTRRLMEASVEPDPRKIVQEVAGPQLGEGEFDQLLGGGGQRDLFGPAVKATEDVPLEEGAKGLTRAQHEPDFFINWKRIEAPEDVENVMAQMADAFRGDVDAARRGVQTFKQIELNAAQENAWQTLLGRRKGEPLNAEQSVAARQLWVSSASKLADVAKLAANDPSEANLFAFRKMLAVHYAIQGEVIAARTETARALASWRIPVGSDAMRAREVEFVLQQSGGADLARELARTVEALANAGRYDALDEGVRKGWGVKTRDAFIEAWVNGLLTSPKTHAVNMMSNTSVIFGQMAERAVAARIGRVLGTDGGVQLGEATAQMFGVVEAAKDMLRFAAGKAKLATEVPSPFDNPAAMLQGKVEARPGAISSEAAGLAKNSILGRMMDGLGTIIRLPGTALEGEDVIFKTFGYRMELHAQALRQATSEVDKGIIPASRLKERIAEIVADPPEHIQLAAVDQALYQTFTNAPGKAAKWILQGKEKMPALSFILPFVRTPANIFSYTFERTPLAFRMSKFKADYAAGGARRDMALAKMLTGWAIMSVVADIATTGMISGQGPSNTQQRQALQRTGWQPYSVKIGDRWYAYNRLDPAGMTMGLAADMVDILQNTEWDKRDTKTAEEVAMAVTISIANNAFSKTYLTGMSDLVEALSDPERYGPTYIQRLAASGIPAVAGEARRAMDPTMREVRSIMDAWRNKTPGLSDELPPRRDLWGREVSYQSGLGKAYDMFSPIYSRQENPEPIDREIVRQGWSISMPPRVNTFDGVDVDLDRFPGAYSRLLELSGNGLKLIQYENLGAMDFLNKVVNGKSQWSEIYNLYTDGAEGGKGAWVKSILRTYQESARRQLLEENAELQAEVERKKAAAVPKRKALQ